MTDRTARALQLAEREAQFERDIGGGVGPLRACLEEVARERVGASPTARLVVAVRAAVSGGASREAALEAAELLARAEGLEAILGSMATSAAEGICTRYSLCELKLARAWLLLAGEVDALSRELAFELVGFVERETNGVGARLERDTRTLRRELDRRADLGG
jgi:hypothetical protein